jgi:hypothetical protein
LQRLREFGIAPEMEEQPCTTSPYAENDSAVCVD